MISRWPLSLALLATLAAPVGSVAVAQSGHEHMHEHSSMEMGEAPGPLPPLKILMPADEAVVGTHLAVIFQTSADLGKMTMNGSAPGVHLHVDAQDVSVMPSSEQLVRLGGDKYLFLFDLPAKPGRNTMSVYWSDAQHRTIADTVQRVTVNVAPEKSH